MTALNYVYNRSAANLRGADAGLIGLVINDLRNPFFTEFAASAQMTFASRGYATVIANTDEDPEHPGAGDRLDDRARGLGPSHLARLRATRRTPSRASDAPASRRCRCCARSTRAPTSSRSPRSTTRPAGGWRPAHLVDLGARRIAFVGGLEDRPVTTERMSGYLAVMAEAGLEPVAVPWPPVARLRARHGARAWRSPIPSSRPPSASATSSRSACSRASPRPASGSDDDFRLVGFDDIEECALSLAAAELGPLRRGALRPALRRGHAGLAGSRRAAARRTPSRPRRTDRAPVEPRNLTCPDRSRPDRLSPAALRPRGRGRRPDALRARRAAAEARAAACW